MSDIHELQREVAAISDRLWPNNTIEMEGLALAEEAGEVARAILKRAEGRRGSVEDWTIKLRTEVAQVVLVALHIATIEKFSLGAELSAELARLQTHDLDHDPVQV